MAGNLLTLSELNSTERDKLVMTALIRRLTGSAVSLEDTVTSNKKDNLFQFREVSVKWTN